VNKNDCKLVVYFAFWIGIIVGVALAWTLWKLVEAGVL